MHEQEDDALRLRRVVRQPGEPAIGDRVGAVFAPLREGSMLDVEGFAPVAERTGS
jgi:uncharacterized OB-fold protein